MIDFFETSNEMLCLADRRGYFLRVNSEWTKTLGWSADELTSRPYLDFVHPDDLAATTREAGLLWSDEHKTIRFENRYRCKDGTYRWLAWRVAPDPESGQLTAAARDVTEQKAQTAALREAEERFRTLATLAPVGIAQANAAGELFFVNEKWCELAGVRPEETLGMKWQNHVEPADLPQLLAVWQGALQAGRDLPPYEFRFRHKTGEVRWASASVSMLKDDDGRVTGQIAAVEDITNRKQAELALREAEERFRAFMDHTPAFAWAKDESGRIVFLNKQCEVRFGTGPQGWRGKTDYDFWPAETAARLQANDRRVLAAGRPEQFFEETDSAESERTHWMTILFPYQDGQGRRFVGGIAIDITDIKRSEAALKAKQDWLRNLIDVQEEERQRLCHEFHDGLIQYAVGALMLLESYQSSLGTGAGATLQNAIEGLRKGIEDGRRTIRGIRPAVLDDSDLAAAVEDLAEQFTASGIRVTCECDEQVGRLPDSLQVTAFRLIQESLNNVRKHSGATAAQVRVKKQDDALLLEIRDQGRGFQFDAARKRGFGLQGMSERAKLAGGEFTVASDPHSGTCITVRLPIPPEDAAAPWRGEPVAE